MTRVGVEACLPRASLSLPSCVGKVSLSKTPAWAGRAFGGLSATSRHSKARSPPFPSTSLKRLLQPRGPRAPHYGPGAFTTQRCPPRGAPTHPGRPTRGETQPAEGPGHAGLGSPAGCTGRARPWELTRRQDPATRKTRSLETGQEPLSTPWAPGGDAVKGCLGGPAPPSCFPGPSHPHPHSPTGFSPLGLG